ncbi:MAG: hypothetical protein HGA44_02510 [Cellulomonadaceae bacterium]|nr:hypothetical protein [Cellulomonadaceae bacterium]
MDEAVGPGPPSQYYSPLNQLLLERPRAVSHRSDGGRGGAHSGAPRETLTCSAAWPAARAREALRESALVGRSPHNTNPGVQRWLIT